MRRHQPDVVCSRLSSNFTHTFKDNSLKIISYTISILADVDGRSTVGLNRSAPLVPSVQVEQLRVEVAEGPKALRDEVSSIFSAFLANTMSEEEAVRRMVGLGCEIQLVDRSELMKSAGDEAGSELAAANMGTDPLKVRAAPGLTLLLSAGLFHHMQS